MMELTNTEARKILKAQQEKLERLLGRLYNKDNVGRVML